MIRPRTEPLHVVDRRPSIARILGGISQVEKIGNGKENRCGLHLATLPFDGFLRIRVAGSPPGRDHETEVPAGTSSTDSEVVRIDVPALRMVTDVAHGTVYVIDRIPDGHLGLGNVADGKDGVSPAEKWRHDPRSDRVRVGLPAPTDKKENAPPIRFLRLQDIEGQVPAIALPVYQASFVIDRGMQIPPDRPGRDGKEQQQAEEDGKEAAQP